MAVAPWIGVDTCLVCSSTGAGTGSTGLIGNFVLTSLLLGINVSFVIRLIRERNPEHSPA
jgi:hypothetical protein